MGSAAGRLKRKSSAEGAPPGDEHLSPMDTCDMGTTRSRRARLLNNHEESPVGHVLTNKSQKSTASKSAAISEHSMPMGVLGSQVCFAEKGHTTLVLDWDDTLFPTTWVREDCKLDWRRSLDEQLVPGQDLEHIKMLLDRHLVCVTDFFREAEMLSNIFLVTLAKRPWVEISIQKFMPGLQSCIDSPTLQVIYAQEYADPKEVKDMRNGNKTPQEQQAFWTSVKGYAIAKELDAFHTKIGASWKNVISFGDSDFERYGTLLAGQDYMEREMAEGSVVDISKDGHTAEGVAKDGKLKRLRVKTVKMLEEPTVVELTAEVTLLQRWLPHVVGRDAGFDIEIDGTDDDSKLQEWNKQMTGEDDPKLNWQDLAGMTD